MKRWSFYIKLVYLRKNLQRKCFCQKRYSNRFKITFVLVEKNIEILELSRITYIFSVAIRSHVKVAHHCWVFAWRSGVMSWEQFNKLFYSSHAWLQLNRAGSERRNDDAEMTKTRAPKWSNAPWQWGKCDFGTMVKWLFGART